MKIPGGCPKCGGDLYDDKDEYDKVEWVCLNCGKRVYGDRPAVEAMRDAREKDREAALAAQPKEEPVVVRDPSRAEIETMAENIEDGGGDASELRNLGNGKVAETALAGTKERAALKPDNWKDLGPTDKARWYADHWPEIRADIDEHGKAFVIKEWRISRSSVDRLIAVAAGQRRGSRRASSAEGKKERPEGWAAFNHLKRSKWYSSHREEIIEDFQEHGFTKTWNLWGIAESTLRSCLMRWGEMAKSPSRGSSPPDPSPDEAAPQDSGKDAALDEETLPPGAERFTVTAEVPLSMLMATDYWKAYHDGYRQAILDTHQDGHR